MWSKSTGKQVSDVQKLTEPLTLLVSIATFQVGNAVCRLSHVCLHTLFFLRDWCPEKLVLRVVPLNSLKLVHTFCWFGDTYQNFAFYRSGIIVLYVGISLASFQISIFNADHYSG